MPQFVQDQQSTNIEFQTTLNDVVDVELEKEKVTYAPPVPYAHRLRAPKKLNNHSEIYELFK